MALSDSDSDSDSDYELDDDVSLDSELSGGGDDDLELEMDELQVDQGAGLGAEQPVNRREHRKVVRVPPGQDHSRMFATKRWLSSSATTRALAMRSFKSALSNGSMS